VKNVTGYDLSKLLCGSFGTLAVMTEVCVKVLPRGETERSLAVTGLDAPAAATLLIAAAKTAHEPSGLAYLPPSAARPAPLKGAAVGGLGLIRLEGAEASVNYRLGKLMELAGGTAETLDETPSRGTWRAIRELDPVPLHDGEALWRFSVPPVSGVKVLQELTRMDTRRAMMDWGGALVWAVVGADADPVTLHRIAAEAGGHARLLRSTRPLADEYPVFPAMSPVRAKLHANIKRAFDPEGILNPGRMWGEG